MRRKVSDSGGMSPNVINERGREYDSRGLD